MPSPTATSMGKYGDIPVSYYTGVPNISVPIYTLQEGSLSQDISLSYHASGIKVAETPSWVGTNWNLNATGMISRTVLGLPDESINGYFNKGHLLLNPDVPQTVPDGGEPQKVRVKRGLLDAEPDLFSFSMGQYSGKFYLKPLLMSGTSASNRAIWLPKSDFKFLEEPTTGSLSTGTGGTIYNVFIRFALVDPMGTIYRFGQHGTEDEWAGEITNFDDSNTTSDSPTSWCLKSITTYDGAFGIYFDYQKERYQYETPSSVSVTYGQGCPPEVTLSTCASGLQEGNICYTKAVVSGVRLKRIRTSSEVVQFVTDATAVRSDLLSLIPSPNPNNYDSARRLATINIRSKDNVTDFDAGTCQKKYILTHEYKSATGDNGTKPYFKRLFLTSVQAMSSDELVKENPYSFEYVTGTLPHKLSKAIDHWGFYNGFVGNDGTGGIPPLTISSSVLLLATGSTTMPAYANANRGTNEQSMLIGSLKKITYPTKGFTEFTMEANEILDYTAVANGANQIFSMSSCGAPNVDPVCCTYHTVTQTKTFTLAELSVAMFKLNVQDIGCFPTNTSANIAGYIRATINGNDVGGTYLNFTRGTNWQYSATFDGQLASFFSITPGATVTFELTTDVAKSDFQIYQNTVSTSVPVALKVGGLRVKKILSNDGILVANDVIKNYSYNNENDVNSSGKLYEKPTYWAKFNSGCYSNYATTNPPNDVSIPSASSFSNLLTVFSNSIVPLSSANGYHIAYETVTESATNNGKTIHNFSIEQPSTAFLQFTGSVDIPLMPRPQEEARLFDGFKVRSKTYAQTDLINPIQQSISQLNVEGKEKPFGNLFAYKMMSAQVCNGSQPYPIYFWTKNNYVTHAVRPGKTTEILNGVETVTTYTYDNLTVLGPTKVATKNSDNVVTTVENTYINNYSFEPGQNTRIINALISRNIIGEPYQIRVYNSAIGNYVSGTKKQYTFYNTAGSEINPFPTAPVTGEMPRLSRIYELQWTTGMTAGTWVNKATFNSYDAVTGKPTSVTTKGDGTNALTDWSPETYTWFKNGLIKTRTFLTFTTTYAYKNTVAGIPYTRLLESIQNIDSTSKNYTYDNLMRLSTESDACGNVNTAYTYQYKDATNDNWINVKKTFTDVTSSGSLLKTTEDRQYLDGLGRPVQSVKIGYGPSIPVVPATVPPTFTIPKHIVTNMAYDQFGRVSKSFTPFELVATADLKKITPAPTVPALTFSLTEYEASPLGRANKTTPPGWFATTTTFGTNNSTDAVLNQATGIAYADNLLSKVAVTDPNGNININFTDKKGRAILSRRTDGTGANKADTYTLYDERDRVVTVIPPDALATSTNLIFKYTYDKSDNLIAKKVPDMDEVKMLYNPRNQLVMVQDGNLKDQNKWICNQYDTYGRPLKSGFYTGVAPTSIAVDMAVPDIWSENAYDGTIPITKGKVTQTKTRVPTTVGATPLWITQNMTYDATLCGQMTGMSTNNHLNAGAGTDVYSYKYDWAGNKTEEKRVHKANTAATPFEYTQNWEYDHSGRHTNYHHKLNANGTKKLLANYQYDFRDRMIERNLGAVTSNAVNSFLQSVDYTYNDLNWMTAINGSADFSALSQIGVVNCGNAPALPNPTENAFAASPDANDIFKLNLFFNSSLSSFGTGTGTAAVAQKNGNISQLQWQVRGRLKQGYNLTYDWLDRMTEAYNAEFTGTLISTPDSKNRFKEKVTYGDKRGNISNLVRNGLNRAVGAAATSCWNFNGQIPIDNLTYTYVAGTNRIQKIAEISPSVGITELGFNPGNGTATSVYAYDKNGNLITDPYKGIAITYNHLNLPSKVFFGGGSTGNEKTIDLLYDFKGQKLQKKFFNASSTAITQDYVSGIEYRNGTIEAIYFPEGRIAILPPAVGTTAPLGRYEYSIKDHLGNTRLTFADLDDNKIVDVPGDILQEQHYYPFGLGMDYTWMNNTAINDTKYLYNGKELNDEVFDAAKRIGLNWTDYGARWYDAAVGRWWAIDPLADKYGSINPYNYVLNNPTNLIDPDGKWAAFRHYNMTKRALMRAGVDRGTAREIANYASVYADNTQGKTLRNNKIASFFIGNNPNELSRRSGVDYEKNKESQRDDKVESHKIHGTRGDSRVISEEAGVTREDAMKRTKDVSNSVIEKYAGSDLSKLTTEQKIEIGVALHGLQDVEAHQGATYMSPESQKKYGKDEHDDRRDNTGNGKSAKAATSNAVNILVTPKTKENQ
jgi:RHS repeat-associated protein